MKTRSPRTLLYLATAISLAQPGAAFAQSRGQAAEPARNDPNRVQAVEIAWRVIGVPEGPGVATLDSKNFAPFATIAPSQTLRSTVAVVKADGTVLIAAGTAMAWSRLNPRLACELTPGVSSEQFICLEDSDSDGAFDTFRRISAAYGKLYGPSEEYKYLVGRYYTDLRSPLLNLVAVNTLQRSSNLSIDVKLGLTDRRGQSYIGLCLVEAYKDIFGGNGIDSYCSSRFSFSKKSTYPVSYQELGASVTLMAYQKGKMSISFTYPVIGSEL